MAVFVHFIGILYKLFSPPKAPQPSPFSICLFFTFKLHTYCVSIIYNNFTLHFAFTLLSHLILPLAKGGRGMFRSQGRYSTTTPMGHPPSPLHKGETSCRISVKASTQTPEFLHPFLNHQYKSTKLH